ncbi:MAG: hydroxysqualene dehydroxylase HpnE [Melioribacter sp.]|uniref:hydroxysqualene dehydroxylase HpnE n=1 Tax=Rosettibacter primus TaxID=3111523 RepID=UPI00247CDC5F|nr:hydroxysqualene dehydroxylase HpnE [Melioribacter sp.]
MKNCLVIGGGFAGLSAAVNLSHKGFKVTLIEASPRLGGRAYSLFNSKHNDFFDNGQHIMMGCYNATLNFLKKIDALDKVNFPDSLKINYVDKGGKIYKLSSSTFFYPMNLIYAFMKFPAISLKSRLQVIKLLAEVLLFDNNSDDNFTVEEWLKRKNQSKESIKTFWEILTVGALNARIEEASAKIFKEVLKRIFSSSKSSLILVPIADLTNLYVKDSEKFIKERGGEIITSERVLKFIVEKEIIEKIVTDKNTYENFDFIISAVQSHSLRKIKIENSKSYKDFSFIPEFNYSPILNVHLWLSHNPFSEKFYGLIDSNIHWVFNHNEHITLTTSAANKIINLKNEELLELIYSELERYFPIFKSEIVIDYKIIKEKRATFIPDIHSLNVRKRILTPFENLVIAGDWTVSDLPSTIESAVMSGYIATEKIIFSIK